MALNAVFSSVKGLAAIVGYTVRTYVLLAVGVIAGYGTLLATVSYFIASNGSTLRGIIAAGLAFALIAVVGFGAVLQLAVSFGAVRAIRDARLGERVFDQLLTRFSNGVSSETQLFDRAEMRTRLNDAASRFLGESNEEGFKGMAKRLAGRLQKMVVNATVSAAMNATSRIAGPAEKVSVASLRENLSGTVNSFVGGFIKGRAAKISIVVFTGVSAAAVLAAFLIRQLPL